MKKVFISYARSDQPFARDLVKHLRDFGTSGWMDAADISAENTIAGEIRSALREADALVVLVSQQSRESQWVNFEIGAGVAMGVPVIPVVIEGEDLRRELPEPLQDVRLIDARNRPIEDIVRDIETAMKSMKGANDRRTNDSRLTE